MDEYRKYLAEQILTGDEVITYRSLSRAMKVHVNNAKQILFDFHKWQNDKRPGAVHATYLLYGIKNPKGGVPPSQSDGDVEMTSSMPEMESFSETVPTFTLSLVTEAGLEDALLQYEEVSSIHIYSLGPHPMKDPTMLADVASKVTDISAAEDLLQSRKTYGTIANQGARRRERKGAGARLAAEVSVKAEAKPAASKAPLATKVKEEPSTASQTAERETVSSAPASKKPAAVPSLKRAGSSSIAQSFAKAAAKPKKTETPKSAAPDGAEDAMSDDGEDDADDLPKTASKATEGGLRKSKKEREEELRRMMDEDDDEPEEEEEEAKADSPPEEAMEEDAPTETPQKEEEPAEVVSAAAGDGRRRGKRRVMKKKQVMDEQGYLVTIQEPGWESFSEDEKAPDSVSKASGSAPSSQTSKPKKAAPKGAQGNIMSFFAKK